MSKGRTLYRLSLCAFLIVLVSIFLNISMGNSGTLMFGNNIPQPRIFYPRSENVDLSQKDNLGFKWSSLVGSSTERRYYDFRLYKGYNIVSDNLIYKKEVPPFKNSWDIESSMFEDGEIYTWTLRQVYLTGKSDRSIISFKIHK